MKLCWMTDVHLNFLKEQPRFEFYQQVRELNADAALLTGDIAEAPSVCNILTEFTEHTGLPTYFVLGNHDFYFGNVADVRSRVTQLVQKNDALTWLSLGDVVKLKDDTILIGQDTWADGRNGDYWHSPIVLNDSRLITDLKQRALMSKRSLLEIMQELADCDAQKIKNTLIEAIAHKPKTIYVACHVPPFSEACFFEGKQSNDDWTPFFSSQATGKVLTELTAKHPEVDFTVLCGHTHEARTFHHSQNMTIKVGQAEYYHPQVEDLLAI